MFRVLGQSSPPWVVLLSGHELNAGMVDVAWRRGARLLVVDWRQTPAVRGDLHLRADIKDHELVLALLERSAPDLAFAYTSSDAATETVALLHAERGLLRPPHEALWRARHKPTMQQCWRAAGLLERRSTVATDALELGAFKRTIEAGVVVKPALGASSRGITLLDAGEDEPESLEAAFARAAAAEPSREVVVEELVEGSEFSVEMLGDGRGNVEVWGIARKHHARHATRNRIASKIHYNPRELASSSQAALAATAQRCYRALGLHSSLGHFEAIVRDDGSIEPIELGARSAGFIFTHLLDAARARDPRFAAAYEAVLRGGEVPDGWREARRSSMYFFYDLPPGVGRRSGASLAQALPDGIETLASGRRRLAAGERFTLPDAEPDRVGFEILSGDRDVLTLAAVERAEEDHRARFMGSRTNTVTNA